MYKALISFAGKVNMTMGEVGEIPDKAVVADLLKAGFIEEVETDKPDKPQKTTTKSGGKK